VTVDFSPNATMWDGSITEKAAEHLKESLIASAKTARKAHKLTDGLNTTAESNPGKALLEVL
jgi:hypothetical protein